MCLAAKHLSQLHPNLIHVTCVAHAVHRLCEKIREMFPDVNRLISSEEPSPPVELPKTQVVSSGAPHRRRALDLMNLHQVVPFSMENYHHKEVQISHYAGDFGDDFQETG